MGRGAGFQPGRARAVQVHGMWGVSAGDQKHMGASAAHGWELHSVHCLLPLPRHRGKSWLGEHFWEEEFRRVTSKISLLTRVKCHEIILDSTQTLFSHDQAGMGPIIPLSVHGISSSSDAGIVLSAIKQILLHPGPAETHSLNSWKQDLKSHINSALLSWQQQKVSRAPCASSCTQLTKETL